MGQFNHAHHIDPAIRSQIGGRNTHISDIRMLSRTERKNDSNGYLLEVMKYLRAHGAKGNLSNMETSLINGFNRTSSDGHGVSTYLFELDLAFALNRDSFKNACFYNFKVDLEHELGLEFDVNDRVETTPMLTDLTVYQNGKRLMNHESHPGYASSIPNLNLVLEFHEKNQYLDDSKIDNICLRTRFRDRNWKNSILGKHDAGNINSLRFEATMLIAVQVDDASDKLLVHFDQKAYEERCRRLGVASTMNAFEDRYLPLNDFTLVCRAPKVGSGLSSMWVDKEGLDKETVWHAKVHRVKFQTAVDKQHYWLERERMLHGKPCYLLNSKDTNVAYALPLDEVDLDGMLELNFNLWSTTRALIRKEIYLQGSHKTVMVTQEEALAEQREQEANGDVFQPAVSEAQAKPIGNRPDKINVYRQRQLRNRIPNLEMS